MSRATAQLRNRAGRFLLSVLAIAGMVLAATATAQAGPHILVELGSGRVLAQEDAFRRWYPASLTKLMTAYVAFRAVKQGELTLYSPVRISANAASEPPSKMGFKPGSVLTLDNALKMIMVKSANDVSTAIGESIAGSEAAFAARMNAEARRIGMVGSNFVNAHGLHSDNQYSTARDLAILAMTIRSEFPQYATYFNLEGISFGQTVMPNHNTLIARFAGADGMKTGYTCPSGFNLIASASRNGRTLLAVVIGELSTETRAEKAAGLLAQGFQASGFAAPRIGNLRPAGQFLNQATNMRPAICTEEARRQRWANRDENGQIVIRSPHIAELNRPRRIVAVSLGGATGPAGTIMPVSANVPVPTPRPSYTPRMAEGG